VHHLQVRAGPQPDPAWSPAARRPRGLGGGHRPARRLQGSPA